MELTSGTWECALAEIIFTKTWYTIPKPGSKLLFSCTISLEPNADGRTVQDTEHLIVNMSAGYYNSMESLTDEINRVIGEALSGYLYVVTSTAADGKREEKLVSLDRDKWPRFRYNPIKKRVHVVMHPTTSITFEPHLAVVLGYREHTITNRSNDVRTMASSAVADLCGGIHSLYVYTDVVENMPVGYTEAPLLRIVNASGNNSESIHRISIHRDTLRSASGDSTL